MKTSKTLSVAMVLLMIAVLVLTSCGKPKTDDDGSGTVQGEQAVQSDENTGKDGDVTSTGDKQDVADNESDVTTVNKTDVGFEVVAEAGPEAKVISLAGEDEDKLIFNEYNVEVSLGDIEIDDGLSIEYNIYNGRENSVSVSFNHIYINNCMVEGGLAHNVAPNGIDHGNIMVNQDQLNLYGITHVIKIGVLVEVTDYTADTKFATEVSIVTSRSKDYPDFTDELDGMLVTSANNVDIYCAGKDIDKDGTPVIKFVIKNNNKDQAVSVDTLDPTMNGKAIKLGDFVKDIAPNCWAITEARLWRLSTFELLLNDNSWEDLAMGIKVTGKPYAVVTDDSDVWASGKKTVHIKFEVETPEETGEANVLEGTYDDESNEE